jgi:hypothetical protein
LVSSTCVVTQCRDLILKWLMSVGDEADGDVLAWQQKFYCPTLISSMTFFSVLGIEPRASSMLRKCCYHLSYAPSPHGCILFLR